ncbi:MAG: hypothetical protein IJU65_00820, partial [Desulfovibrio sp.]|nr:hypothetical protein [Desulfovibrio sp.]
MEALSPVMAEEVALPMDAVMELQQSGIDLLTPLGISPEAAQAAAEEGQAVHVSLGNLHTMLDAQQFKAASEIMQRGDNDAAARDDENAELDRILRQALNDNELANDVRNGTASLSQEQKTELDAVHEDFRQQLTEAVRSVPGLANQVEIQAGFEPYVDSLLQLWRRRAIVAARRTGENPADIYRRTALNAAQQLRDNLEGKTPEQRIEDDFAKDEAQTLYDARPTTSQDYAGFIANARTGANEYMVAPRTPDKVREYFGIPNLVLDIPYNYVRHLDNEHPGTADDIVPETERVLAEADRIERTGTTRDGMAVYTAIQYRGDEAIAIAFRVSQSRQKGNRAVPISGYTGHRNTIDSMVAQKKEIPRSAGDAPSKSKPSMGDPTELGISVDQTLSETTAIDKSVSTIATSTGDEAIRYEVRELDSLIASHDPTVQFQKRVEYPEGVQERPYHSDPGEQDKVRRNAANLDPRYLVNNNPDAMSG